MIKQRLIAIVMILSTSMVSAQSLPDISFQVLTGSALEQASEASIQPVSFAEFLMFYFNTIGKNLPQSTQYINVQYTNIKPGNAFYEALQKGIYMDFIKNAPIKLEGLSVPVTEGILNAMVLQHFGVDLELKSQRKLDRQKMVDIVLNLPTFWELRSKPYINQAIDMTTLPLSRVDGFSIFNTVFWKLKQDHLHGDDFNTKDLLYGAAEGLAKATKDQHTVFFPPTQSKNFNDELNGSFEGIGAMVEMKTPGQLVVVSPIVNSPAEKAGIQAGDQIIKIGTTEVTKDINLQEAVSLIKGPAKSTVILMIKRGEQTLQISVIRDTIIIKFVEHKVLENNDYYIKIGSFGFGVSKEFDGAMNAFKKSQSSKLIIDLRNNPGGSLDEVDQMLRYFVPQGSGVVVIQSKNGEQIIPSLGGTFDRVGKKIMILINGGSASASEIMAGTIKDYHPSTKVIGQKSYGKGSVQVLEDFPDGSSIKYTISKRFTGKTKNGIDGVGIEPDITINPGSGAINQDIQLELAKKLQGN